MTEQIRICKYCGRRIPRGEVWNPDQNGNGYHYACIVNMEFDEDAKRAKRSVQNCILDKIRTEIEQAADKQFQIAMGIADLNERYAHIQMENAYRHSLNIIDKYKAEIEPQESENKV